MGNIANNLIKSALRAKGIGDELIISKDRVTEHGEVLTPPNIVSDMLDMVGKEYGEKLGKDDGTLPIKKTFLEPACGTGNFLVQILERKLRLCTGQEDIFNAVASIYGVDIQKDNVTESRLRMLEIVEDKCPDEKFLSLIADVLEKNIMGGNTLTDKRGCDFWGTWQKGTVFNSTGLVEDDGISHDRLIAYTWNWNNGEPTSTAEFLIEDENEEVKVEVKQESQEDLMSKFAGMFGGK